MTSLNVVKQPFPVYSSEARERGAGVSSVRERGNEGKLEKKRRVSEERPEKRVPRRGSSYQHAFELARERKKRGSVR